MHAAPRPFAFTALLAACALPARPADARPPVHAAETAVVISAPAPAETDARWLRFSKGLVASLRSTNDGVVQSALQHVITYGDRVRVRGAEFDVVRVYREHRDDRMRRMAVVAIGKMGSPWALGFLQRSLPFERSASVRHTMKGVLAETQPGWTASY